MATIALLIGGAVLNATAFVGGSYLAKHLEGSSHTDTERIRHDKALEKYQHDMVEYQKAEKKYQDWMQTQYVNKKQADENLDTTDQAFVLFSKTHPDSSFKLRSMPDFNDYYQPSNKQKQYELMYVGGGMLIVGYVASKFI